MSNARAIADIVQSGSIVGAGKILQVKQTQFTGTNTISCSSNTDTVLTDLTVDITPTSTSSIIKIEAMVNGEWTSATSNYNSPWFFYRDSTKLAASNAGNRNAGILMSTGISIYTSDAGSSPEMAFYSYFDTPSTTSQVTYKVGVNQAQASTQTWHLNKTVVDTDNNNYERGVSYICVTEIAN